MSVTDEERRLLACSSSGGHFKQLVSLVARIPDVGPVTWVTYDSGIAHDLLRAAGRGDDRVVFAPYASPRDWRNLARDGSVIRRLLREDRYDLAVSTGAGIAVAALPLARTMGVRSCFIESATRTMAPSLSGRILQRLPGIELYTQNAGFPPPWRYVGSVHDEFEPGPGRDVDREIRRVVVTLGTSEAFGFRRLVERLAAILPSATDVLWQTGITDTTGLDIDGRVRVPTSELEQALLKADAVVAHAGTGSALTAFELGICPLLVPRRVAFGENVDDHQVVTALDLADRGLSVHAEADQVSMTDLDAAARRSVTRRTHTAQLRL